MPRLAIYKSHLEGARDRAALADDGLVVSRMPLAELTGRRVLQDGSRQRAGPGMAALVTQGRAEGDRR